MTPGAGPASTGVTVKVDLSSIGGSPTQSMFDDGSNGDVAAGDGTFSFLAPVLLGSTPGPKTLTATISDAQNRSSTTGIALTVLTPTSLQLAAAATPISATLGSPVLFTATVTNGTQPTSTGVSVAADLTSIGGSATQALVDDGTNGDLTAGDGVYSFATTVAANAAAGPKLIPVSATDAQGRTASQSVAFNVQAPSAPTGTVWRHQPR